MINLELFIEEPVWRAIGKHYLSIYVSLSICREIELLWGENGQ